MMVSRWPGIALRLAVGCWLAGSLDVAAAWAEDAVDPPVTYTKDIAPILWNHCAGCHRPGEVGPFSLLTYRDAAKRANFLTDVTHKRLMPPWKPAPGGPSFHDERRLSKEEMGLIARWARAGAPEGDPAHLPDRPEFIEGWQLGEPDLVLTMREPFAVPAGGRDVYRCFVIPIPIDEDRMVAAVEFRAGNRSVVHHSIMFLDANGAAPARRRRRPAGLRVVRRSRCDAHRRAGGLAPRHHRAATARGDGPLRGTRQRPGAADALSPDRQGRDRSVVRGHLLRQTAGRQDRHRHRGHAAAVAPAGGQGPLRREDAQPPAAGRRQPAGNFTPHALPGAARSR